MEEVAEFMISLNLSDEQTEQLATQIKYPQATSTIKLHGKVSS